MQHAQAARPRPRSLRKTFAPTPLALAAGRARHGRDLGPCAPGSLSLVCSFVRPICNQWLLTESLAYFDWRSTPSG
eukprot:5233069-Prymnesium_polylepis.1